jgi:hypothetical protein
MELVIFILSVASGWFGLFQPPFLLGIPAGLLLLMLNSQKLAVRHQRRYLYLVSLLTLGISILLINSSSSGLGLLPLALVVELAIIPIMIWGIVEILLLSHQIFGEKS